MSVDFDNLFDKPPYSLEKEEKEYVLLEYLRELSLFHYENCVEYRKIIKASGIDISAINELRNVPFLPVRLFKDMELCSVPKDEVIKTMYSSGTTGKERSKIFLDKETASRQQKVMIKIVADFIGSKRLPMLIIDSRDVLRDRTKLAVRGAAILGFSIAGTDRFFALDDELNVDLEGIKGFLKKHADEKILIFGFTSMIWQYFYKTIADGELGLSKAVLIHGGGWKKLISEQIDNNTYKLSLRKRFNIQEIYDYYGMVEQTGCIYMECKCGHLHVSNFSEIIVRRTSDFSVADIGEEGLIQVVSTIPKSYPGHSLLTEDKGVILGEDDCPCGRKGKYFKIIGRIIKAEIRGCSDVY